MSPAPSPQLGLYLHFPFCAYKCGYCDFNSWVEKDTEPQRQWLRGIQNEIRFWKNLRHGALNTLTIDTLFMGGGTPSLLKEELWVELCSFLKSELNFSSDLEWTVEANPETINEKLLAHLNGLGVNRLSLGIQSFKEKFLKRLERGASPEANRRALQTIQEKWPHRWSLDLMFGLPEQSLQEWAEDLQAALSFSPQHLSAYQLTLTTQKSKAWRQGTDSELLEFFRQTRENLSSSGIRPYEISNFSVSGEECRHNLKYWRAESFLGLGPGAYSLLPAQLLSDHRWGGHLKNPSRMDQWAQWTEQPDLSKIEKRSEEMHVTELLMLGLRLEEGIEKEFFPSDVKWDELQRLSHLIEIAPNKIKATQRGREILDATVLEAVRCLYPA